MSDVLFRGTRLTIDGRVVDVGMEILDAFALGDRVIVLGDPDSYLGKPDYREQRRAGLPAVRNLAAFAADGRRLWEAEFPEDVDYYYRIESREPLVAQSFSSFRCRIDPATGRIIDREFLK